jgi:hypothetical protein
MWTRWHFNASPTEIDSLKSLLASVYFLRLGGLEIGPYLSLRPEVDGGISPSHDRILEKVFAINHR